MPGDSDAVNALKLQCDSWSLQLNCTEPCVAASLLKLWYRELSEPLVPFDFYDDCVANHDNVDAALHIVTQLPQLNHNVLKYFIRFLQVSTLVGSVACIVVSGVRRMNKVNARRARLVPGWVTVFGRVYHLSM